MCVLVAKAHQNTIITWPSCCVLQQPPTNPPLSLQSTSRLIASAPTTSTFFAMPVRMYCAAVTSASTKPLQAAVRSNATAFLAPIAACTCYCGGVYKKQAKNNNEQAGRQCGAKHNHTTGTDVLTALASCCLLAGRTPVCWPSCCRAANPALMQTCC